MAFQYKWNPYMGLLVRLFPALIYQAGEEYWRIGCCYPPSGGCFDK
jgi:hypothetical protein